MKLLTPELLEQITKRLVAAMKPEQIILFGSYAYGEPTEDSDVDLLVIVSQSDEPRYRRARGGYKALRGLGIPKDILVMTRSEVEQPTTVTSVFVSQVLRQGKVLYG
jgi:uncharacterized protein